MGHAPDRATGDFVRLELFDPTGALRLRRDIPLRDEACAAVAQAIAIVLARYFSELGWTSGTPLPSTGDAAGEPADDDNTEPPPPPHAPMAAAPSSDPARRREPPAPAPARFGLGIGAAHHSAPSGVRGAAELFYWPAAWLELGAGALFPGLTRDPEAVNGGSVSATSYPVRAWLGWSRRDSNATFMMGPELLLVVERGSGAGLEQSGAGSRLLWGAGARAAAGLRVGSRWRLLAQAAIDVVVPEFQQQFHVARPGATEPLLVLQPSTWQTLIQAGVSFELF
jgi:hypothetical protein